MAKKNDKTALLAHCDFFKGPISIEILLNFWPKFNKTADSFDFRPNFNKTTGLAPCSIFFYNLRPKFNKTAGLAPCDFFNFYVHNYFVFFKMFFFF